MSDIAHTFRTQDRVKAEVHSEAREFAYLTVLFFGAVFGGLTTVLTGAHYLTQGMF